MKRWVGEKEGRFGGCPPPSPSPPLRLSPASRPFRVCVCVCVCVIGRSCDQRETGSCSVLAFKGSKIPPSPFPFICCFT